VAEVIPFNGVLYNVSNPQITSGRDVLSPPYDIIGPELQEELYGRSPYNIVRVDFGRTAGSDSAEDNKYRRARGYLDKWLSEDILLPSGKPCFYSYEISYKIEGREKRLRGFMGLVKLEELGKGNIHPHECTHSKPKKDRLDLMRTCEANISPIFSLYSSRDEAVSAVLAETNAAMPRIEAADADGAVHRLWEISAKQDVEAIMRELEGRPIFIADGHHRYETALEYQKEMRQKEGGSDGPKPYDYVMMFLANMTDEGLTILPTHRLVRRIPEGFLSELAAWFDITKVMGDFDIAGRIRGNKRVLGLYTGDADSWYVLKYTGGDLTEIPEALAALDVSLLHELIIGKLLHSGDIIYEMDIDRCLNLVRSGQFEAAFFLNPTEVGEVENVALASLRMPPKSTYFYPKLLTGLVLNLFKYTF
jgi:uncharacterized protein (DUF1015 family)